MFSGSAEANGSTPILLRIFAYSNTAVSPAHLPKNLCTIARGGVYLSQIPKFRLECTVLSTADFYHQ